MEELVECREDHLKGGEIYYREWYSPTDRANVVIAHGYAEHSGRYAHVAERLTAANLSVWAPDHRGHGHSAGQRGDIGSLADAVRDLDLHARLWPGLFHEIYNELTDDAVVDTLKAWIVERAA